MSPADRKRLLVALCACDRVELCLHHFRPVEPQLPFQNALPWLGMITRFFRRRSGNSSSPLAPLIQLAMGFFRRRR